MVCSVSQQAQGRRGGVAHSAKGPRPVFIARADRIGWEVSLEKWAGPRSKGRCVTFEAA